MSAPGEHHGVNCKPHRFHGEAECEGEERDPMQYACELCYELNEPCAAHAPDEPAPPIETRGTAGPWTLCYDGQIDGPNGEMVCRFAWTTFKEFNDDPTAKANAALIAAAPALLERLKAEHDIDAAVGWDAPDCPTCAAIRAAEGRG